MKTKEDLMKEYFKATFPNKVFIKTLTHKEFGAYFKVIYTDTENSIESTVDINYLEFITWIFNNYIAPDNFYVNLN